jgi:hypothetical protein
VHLTIINMTKISTLSPKTAKSSDFKPKVSAKDSKAKVSSKETKEEEPRELFKVSEAKAKEPKAKSKAKAKEAKESKAKVKEAKAQTTESESDDESMVVDVDGGSSGEDEEKETVKKVRQVRPRQADQDIKTIITTAVLATELALRLSHPYFLSSEQISAATHDIVTHFAASRGFDHATLIGDIKQHSRLTPKTGEKKVELTLSPFKDLLQRIADSKPIKESPSKDEADIAAPAPEAQAQAQAEAQAEVKAAESEAQTPAEDAKDNMDAEGESQTA